MDEQLKIFKELGNVYYRFVSDDKIEKKRIIGIQNSEVVRVKDLDTNNVSKVKISEFKDSGYQLLIHDGFILFSVVSMVNKSDNKIHKDVMISLYREDDIESNIPYCICRQGITDVFYNLLKTGQDIDLVGMSVTQDTCPAELDFNMVRMCNGINYCIGVNIYMNDTLDDILEMIKTDKFDETLQKNFVEHHRYLRQYNPFVPPVISGNYLEGYCRDLRTLLTVNNFMYDFYSSFNIIPVNCKIKTDAMGYLCDTAQITDLSGLLRINMINPFVVEYSKSIDLEKIDYNYNLIKDGTDKILVLAYDVDDDNPFNAPTEEYQEVMRRAAKIADYYNKYSNL